MKSKSSRKSVIKATTIGGLVLFPAVFFIILTACATPAPPPQAKGETTVTAAEGVPGGVVVNTVEVHARVVSVDQKKRKATLMDETGEKFTVKVGPEAVNFDQVKKGDLLKVVLTEELVIFLDEEGTETGDAGAGVVALAPKGAKPGGVVAGTVQVVGTIVSIDAKSRTATLRFEDDSTKVFPVRDDIDLSQRKAGERVVFQITEMVAISVEKE